MKQRSAQEPLSAILVVLVIAATILLPAFAAHADDFHVAGVPAPDLDDMPANPGDVRLPLPGSTSREGLSGQPQSPDADGGSRGSSATASADGAVLEIQAAGKDVLVIGRTGSSAEQDRTASAHGSVLAAAGHEIVGSRADSGGGQSSSSTGYLTESCDLSSGSVCLALLYGRSSAQQSGSSSFAESYASLLSVCMGGSAERPEERCDGLIEARIAESRSSAQQDQESGLSYGEQEVRGADACVGGTADANGTCEGIGVGLLHSGSSSRATSSGRTASTRGSVATVEAGGQERLSLLEPEHLSLPPGCAGDALVCATVNRHRSAASSGTGESNREATRVEAAKDAADGDDVLSGTASRSNAGAGAASKSAGPVETPTRLDTNRATATGAPSALAVTGRSLVQFALIGCVVVALGAALKAAGRAPTHRRE